MNKSILRELSNNISPFDTFNTKEDIFSWITKNKKITNINNDNFNTIFKEAAEKRLQIEEDLKNCFANYITVFDENYPENLINSSYDYPPILFYKGNISLLKNNKSCSIIGTRNPNKIGEKLSYESGKKMSSLGYVVISGLAKGCDTFAHKGCLDAGGKTIAIIANSIDTIYPKENTELFKEILEKDGLIISENEPKRKIEKYSFIERDRLQAMFSNKVITIQTSIDGGTMYASKATKKYGKELLVYDPNTLNQEEKSGNKYLIETYNGKKIQNVDELY